jgi:SRSO17 transposase
MPKITRFPFFGKRFFRQARKLCGSCQFEHFWRLVVCIGGMHGRHSLKRIEELLGKRRTRQALAHFLTKAQWDAPELLRQTALDTLKQMGYRAGDTLYLVLDDTQKRKRGKLMDAVSKIFLHAEKVYANGHTILGCCLIYRGVVIPYAVRLWASQSSIAKGLEAEPGVPLKFRKLTQLAADVIGEVQLPEAGKVIASMCWRETAARSRSMESLIRWPNAWASCRKRGG